MDRQGVKWRRLECKLRTGSTAYYTNPAEERIERSTKDSTIDTVSMSTVYPKGALLSEAPFGVP